MTLNEFLLARIAEDEAVAQKAEANRDEHLDALWVVTGMDNAVGVDYDPDRVLAECEAKRRIVEECSEFRKVADATAGDAPLEQALAQAGVVQGLERTVAHLASIYADHPDYQQEWKP